MTEPDGSDGPPVVTGPKTSILCRLGGPPEPPSGPVEFVKVGLFWGPADRDLNHYRWFIESKARDCASLAHQCLGHIARDHTKKHEWGSLEGCCESCETVRLARRKLGRAINTDWNGARQLIEAAIPMLAGARLLHSRPCYETELIRYAISEMVHALEFITMSRRTIKPMQDRQDQQGPPDPGRPGSTPLDVPGQVISQVPGRDPIHVSDYSDP